MSLSLAMGKHIFYEHRAVIKSAMLPVLVMASLGVFFELFNSSSQQQNIAYDHAENSKAFASVAGTAISIGSVGDGYTLAYYQGELAKAKQYLATCKKTCSAQRAKVAEYSAKVDSILSSQKTAAAGVATATTAAIKTKAETLQNLKDEAHKPVFKFARDLLGITIATAVVLVAGLVSAGFEYGHAYMSKVLGEKLAYVAALREQLAKLQSGYLGQTGKTYATGDMPDSAAVSPIPANAFAPFKWKQRAQQAGEAIGREMLKAQAARDDLHTQAQTKAGKLGNVLDKIISTQPAPDTATYRQELQEGSTLFRDVPLDAPSLQLPVGENANSDKSSAYALAGAAKVGSVVACPNCGKQFIKANKWHLFCSNNRKPREGGGNCSDEWHNAQNPERLQAIKGKHRKRKS
jgi:hypothetical protein